MTDRSDLVRAIHAAKTGRDISRAVAALDAHDRAAVRTAAADRELDLGHRMAASRLDPVPVHELHTAATDWLADFQEPQGDGNFRTAMIAEASTWYSRLDPAVREDGQELTEQARGRARSLASAYGSQARAAEREFLQTVGYLQSQAASGLPQIDQTIDPNNQPSATPYPAEVFPTFGEEQDQFNGVETNNHGSGAASTGAPMLQQLQQQQNSGSGFGSGPEKPDEHGTAFDTSNSYAEVPLGTPGQIPTAAPGQGPTQPSSAPTPMEGQPQDEGADRRQAVAAVQGYSFPDAFGYRWVMTSEVMHPFHEKCAAAHWPEEGCGDRSHTASVAIGYQMDLDKARLLAGAERLGVQEGLRAFHGSKTLADLVVAHNRFTSAWGESDRSDADSAVLHGFMAVVRPVMAEMLPNHAYRGDEELMRRHAAGGLAAGGVTEQERADATHHLPGTDKFPIDSAADVRNALHDVGRTNEPHAKVMHYLHDMENEYHVGGLQRIAASGGCANCQHGDHEGCRTGQCDCAKAGHKAHQGSRLDFRGGAAGPRQGASSLTQVQQITDPDNQPTPQDDSLPEGVAFPLNEEYSAQWVTGPGGAAPKGATPQAEAGGMKGLPQSAAQMFGHMDAVEGKEPHHKDHYPYTSRAHGSYLRGWNNTNAVMTAYNGTDPINREAYSGLTGRPDLHAHWRDAYDTAVRNYSTNQGHSNEASLRTAADSGSGVSSSTDRCADCGHERSQTSGGCVQHCPGCACDPSAPPRKHVPLRPRQADAWSQPRQTTDDFAPPFSQPATNAPMTQNQGDYEAGAAAAKADKASGQRPAFADNSSAVSPYVKGYAETWGASSEPQGAQDVPYSMGGDSGQAMNAQEAQRGFQASPLSEISAAFVPAELRGNPDFSKAYRYAQIWGPGTPLVKRGSAAFEAGLYAGVTDRPQIQQVFLAEHALHAKDHPDLAQRIALHRSFSVKTAGKTRGLRTEGAYLVRKAGTTTDLITDGPGTSPDPMGATPLNGPGTPPPMGGLSEPAAPGGAPPYQGAPPLSGGPVVPDDVMGHSQQEPQPDGPFTSTFSGDHPENTTLAPVAPNSADEPGYSNKDAYQGGRGPDRVAMKEAFRRRVQAGLAQMREAQ
jgi:hypothetical protein